jgi:hypothetical protein
LSAGCHLQVAPLDSVNIVISQNGNPIGGTTGSLIAGESFTLSANVQGGALIVVSIPPGITCVQVAQSNPPQVTCTVDPTVAVGLSSGDVLQDASSGGVLQDASSGDVLQDASSGDVLQDTSSGDVLQDTSVAAIQHIGTARVRQFTLRITWLSPGGQSSVAFATVQVASAVLCTRVTRHAGLHALSSACRFLSFKSRG